MSSRIVPAADSVAGLVVRVAAVEQHLQRLRVPEPAIGAGELREAFRIVGSTQGLLLQRVEALEAVSKGTRSDSTKGILQSPARRKLWAKLAEVSADASSAGGQQLREGERACPTASRWMPNLATQVDGIGSATDRLESLCQRIMQEMPALCEPAAGVQSEEARALFDAEIRSLKHAGDKAKPQGPRQLFKDWASEVDHKLGLISVVLVEHQALLSEPREGANAAGQGAHPLNGRREEFDAAAARGGVYPDSLCCSLPNSGDLKYLDDARRELRLQGVHNCVPAPTSITTSMSSLRMLPPDMLPPTVGAPRELRRAGGGAAGSGVEAAPAEEWLVRLGASLALK